MAHLTNTLRSATFLLGTAMLMLFLFCAPMHAQAPTFKSTSSYRIANPNYSAQQLDPTTIGHQAYHSTIYTPFGSSTPSSNNNPGGNNDSGSGTDDDDIGIPGWADTPSEPLPIGDTAPLFLFAAAMITLTFIKQRRKQLQTSDTTNNDNTMHNTRHTSSNRLQKLFLFLVFVCFVGQASADKNVYFRPSTACIDTKTGSFPYVSWAKLISSCKFEILRSTDGTTWDSPNPWHKEDDYTSADIYEGNQSRFLPLTLTESTIDSKFAFYRVYTWQSDNEEKFNQDKTNKYNCVPNDKWWNNQKTWNTEMFDLNILGNHNLVCITEGEWSDYYFAYYVENDIQLYFANIYNWKNPTFVRGKDIYSYQHTTTQIPNTNLYTTTLIGNNDIAYKDYAFIDNSNNGWGDDLTDLWKTYQGKIQKTDDINATTLSKLESNRLSNRYYKATKYSAIMQDDYLSGNTLFLPGKTNDKALTKTSFSSWEDLNHTLTIKNYTYNTQNNLFEQNNIGGSIQFYTHQLNSGTTTSRSPASGYETVETESRTTAAYSAVTQFIATPNSGYEFIGWYDGDGRLLSTLLTYSTYVVPNEDSEVHARFATKTNKLTVSVLNYNPEHEKFEEYGYEYNTITLTQGSTELKKSYSSFSHTFNEATTVTLTAAPEDDQVTGYNFSGWYINDICVSTEFSYELTISSEVAIQARFAPKNCNVLTLEYNIGGTYTIRYSKNEQFNPASTKESSLTENTYTHFSLIQQTGEKHYFDVTAIQPIHGYIYKEGKLGGVTIQLGEKTSRGKNGNVKFRANFVRKDDQVVYLNVENASAGSNWLPAAESKYYAYLYNPYTANKLWLEMTPISEKLFTCTIPGDNYTELRFVHSTNLDLNGSTEMTVEQLQIDNQYKNRSTVQTIPATRYNCYKILGGWSNNERVDAWTTRPKTTGDYRILYIEQTGGEINYTFDKCDVVTKHTTPGTYQDIVSLHIYNKVANGVNGTNNPEIILQRWNGTEWQDLERHMIFRNNGITNINAAVNDEDHACGVWNFTIQQTVAQGGDVTATILLDETKKYTGNYYIRTANATGGYNNFTHPENIISYSEYAKNHSDYSHYFIRHIDINEDGNPSTTPGTHKHIAFTIANDYAMFLNHELMVDNPLDKRFFPEGETDIFVENPLYDNGQPTNAPNLPADATVRFGWDIRTNRLTRAYIADTKLKNNEYLVIEGTNITDTLGNALQPQGETTYFNDNSNYLYSIDLTAKANAALKVKARLNGQYQYFMGTDQEGEPLISGNGENTYPIRLLYDFKDDRFTTVYRPKTALSGTIDLETPVMIERVHNDAPTQITFENNATINNAVSGTFDQPAYAVMTFLESVLANVEKTHHEKMFYWISFPFDVCIRDVFGLGDYGKYWIMEEYDGEQRAKDGLAKSNWKYITKKSAVLEKNKGYVLCLNYSQILQDKLFSSYNSDDNNLNNGKLSLYFPSVEAIDPASIKENPEAYIYLPEYKTANTAWNHHNWHIIGVPSFADPEFIDIQTDVPFVYVYWHPGDAYAAVSINDINFHAMHAYMVQYTGGLSWTKIVNTTGSVTPKSLAAKTDEEADKKVMLRLELQQAGSTIDKTYVQLRNDKGTKGFDMSLDLTKIINAGANIYSIVDNHEMAGNAIPKEETILPLGVVITAAGDYTFAMPQGTEGMLVELIDYETGECTNLLMSDYTVNMPAGTNNTRFALRLKPDKVATNVEDITSGTNDNNVRKLLIDGVLYLIKDSTVYDAQGHCVQ